MPGVTLSGDCAGARPEEGNRVPPEDEDRNGRRRRRRGQVVALITDAAKTGSFGDGKVFVEPLEEAVRIRTGERGDNAV